MADRIHTELPPVVQNVTVTVSGQERLDALGRALNRLTAGTKMNEYFSDQEEMIKRVTRAYEKYINTSREDTNFEENAGELIKTLNALKSVSDNIDLSEIIDGFSEIEAAAKQASRATGDRFSIYSVKDFRDIIALMQELTSQGYDVSELFNKLGADTDLDALNLKLGNTESELENVKTKLSETESELQDFKGGEKFRQISQELDEAEESAQRFRRSLEYARDAAEREWADFLRAHEIDPYQDEDPDDIYSEKTFQSYIDNIQDGTWTAREAIARFKAEYSELLESAGGGFDSMQVEVFTQKLEQIFNRIEEIYNLINNPPAGGTGAIQRRLDSDTEAAEDELDIIRKITEEDDELADAGNTIREIAAASDAGTQQIGEFSATTISLVEALTQLANAGEDSLWAINSIFQSTNKISNLEVDLDEFENLKQGLQSLSELAGLEKINYLSNINLSGFSGLSVSKSSLRNLAEYLPQLARIPDIERLRELSNINFSNFNTDDLNVKKTSSFKNFVELVKTLHGETEQATDSMSANIDANIAEQARSIAEAVQGERSAISNANEDLARHVELLEAAAQAENEKREAAEKLARALGIETTEIRSSMESIAGEDASVDKDIDKQRQYDQALARVADTLKRVQSEKDKLSKRDNGTAQPEYAQLTELESRLITLRDAGETNSLKYINDEMANMRRGLSETLQSLNLFEIELKDFETELAASKQEADALEQAIGHIRDYTNELDALSVKVTAFQKVGSPKGIEDVEAAYGRLRSLLNVLKSPDTSIQDKIDADKEWASAKKELNSILSAEIKLEKEVSAANKKTEAEKKAAAREYETENKMLEQQQQQLAQGAEKAARGVLKLYDDMSKLKDFAGVNFDNFDELVNLLRTARDESLDFNTRSDALRKLNEAIANTTRELKLKAEADKQADAAAKEAAKTATDNINAEKRREKMLQEIERQLQQCEEAEREYYLAGKNGSGNDAYESLQYTAQALRRLKAELSDATYPTNEQALALEGLKTSAARAKTELSGFKGVGSWFKKGLGGWFSSGLTQLQSDLTYTFGLAAVVTKSVQEIKKMISVAVELDSALNELQVVTRSSGAEMEEYSHRVSNMAQETAQATKDLIDATTVYARLGYSMDESSVLAKYTAMLQGVGNIDASAAQDAITAIVKAFDIGVNDIETAMDKMVVVGNNFPISVSQIAEGMNNAGSMLAVAGNSFDQSIALLTAANTTIQNISKASTGLRTIAARIRKTTTEDEDGEVINEAKYEEMIDALTRHNVQLTEANGEYKSTYDVIKDIARVWKQLTSMEQAAVIEALAGTRQQNIFASLMTQFGEAEKAVERMGNSAGELEEAFNIKLGSIESHVQRLKSAFDRLSMDFVDSDIAKGAVDILTKVVNILDTLINKFGVISTLLGGVAIGAIIKNFGTITKFVTGIGAAKGMEWVFEAPTLLDKIGGALASINPTILATVAAVTALTAIAVIAVKEWKKAHPTFEELKSDADKAGKEVDSLSKTIEENKKRIEELNNIKGSGSFTAEQQEELEKLQAQNAEYEAQLALLKDIYEHKQAMATAKANEDVTNFLNNSNRGTVGYDETGTQFSVRSNEGLGGLLNLLDDYKAAVKNLDNLKEQRAHFLSEGTEESAERARQLLDDVALAEQRVANAGQNIYDKQAELLAYKTELSKATDEESAENIARINGVLDLISETTGKSSKSLDDFKKRMRSLSDNAVKYLKGETSDAAKAQEELTKALRDGGYSADEAAKYFREYCQELSNSSSDGTILDDHATKWRTITDTTNSAKAALEEYNKALESGNSGDIAAQMQQAWQKAMEDIDKGRYSSKAVRAFADMAFDEETVRRFRQAPEVMAQMIRALGELFDDTNLENGYSDEDNLLGYGQRFLEMLRRDQASLNGVDVWDSGDNIKYTIASFKELAKQLGYTDGFVDAFIEDLAAYGDGLIMDTEQTTALVNSLQHYTNTIGDAREATKAFVKDAIKQKPTMTADDIETLLYDLNGQGFLTLDPAEYQSLVAEALEETKQDAAEANATVTMHPDVAGLDKETSMMLNNFQSYLNTNPLIVKYVGDYSQAQPPDGTVPGNANNGTSGEMDPVVRWGNANGKKPGQGGGKTLVNELGPELISDRGRAFIANHGKPGFVNLSRDAIVFPADETKDILRRNHFSGVTPAFANGTNRHTNNGLFGSLISGKQYSAKKQVEGISTQPITANGSFSKTGTTTGSTKVQQTGTGNTTVINNNTTINGTMAQPSVHSVSTVQQWSCPSCGYLNPTTIGTCQRCGGSRYGGGSAGATTTPTRTQTWQCSWCGTQNPTSVGICGGCRRSRYGGSTRVPVSTQPTQQAQQASVEQSINPNKNPNNFQGTPGGVGGANYASQSEPSKVDWVAVRLNRIQRAIADLEKVASSGFKNLDTRLTATKDEIGKTKDLISNEQSAYSRYMREAESVGLSSSIASLIKNGTIDIREYDDETRKKIDEYTEW